MAGIKIITNYSFSGCGFLLPYHLGVANYLHNTSLLDNQTSKLAGASGGAIAAAGLAANISVLTMFTQVKDMAAYCRQHGTAWKLEKYLRDALDQVLPSNAVELLANRVTIATTQIYPKPEICFYNSFSTRQDVIEAIVASCFIPSYISPAPLMRFRKGWHCDGGLIKIVPELNDYVKVCVFYQDIFGKSNFDISPNMLHSSRFTTTQLLRYALLPPSDDMLQRLFLQGEETAKIWHEKISEKPLK